MTNTNKSVAMQAYEAWLADSAIDEAAKEELRAIAGDSGAIEDRFFMDLQFGTAGLRGVLGMGSNRMNRYIVARATQGYANTLLETPGAKEKGVAIAYDSRRMSDVFAHEAAQVLCGNGIRVYLSDDMRSVPQLSFAIGHYGCAGGIVITASHNPKQYNGYKVYAENGAQIDPVLAQRVTDAIVAVLSFSAIRRMNESEAVKKGLLQSIGTEWDDAYFAYTKALCADPAAFSTCADLAIVYTPLYGTGVNLVPRILRELGLQKIYLVEEQAVKDPDFSTVSAPNPEAPDAFRLAIEKAASVGAELVLATDPDADRLGAAQRDPKSGAFRVLSGNQLGCLMLHDRLQSLQKQGKLPKNALAVRSIVSTQLADAIAADFGVEMREVLTGFRYIGEIVADCETSGENAFVFGFEESFGYSAGTRVRDKDAICAAMMLTETYAHYAARGMTLFDGLDELFARYGAYADSIKNYTLMGKSGMEQIQAAMRSLRTGAPTEIAGVAVDALRDYAAGARKTASGETMPIALPAADVLYFEMADGSWICVRPSGTEPKLKIYVSAKAGDFAAAQAKAERFIASLAAAIEPVLGV